MKFSRKYIILSSKVDFRIVVNSGEQEIVLLSGVYSFENDGSSFEFSDPDGSELLDTDFSWSESDFFFHKTAIDLSALNDSISILNQNDETLSENDSQLALSLNEIESRVSSLEDSEIVCPLPIGFVYTQKPGKKPPMELWPTTTWKNISDEWAGDFFRVEGGNASMFESGKQLEAIAPHTHEESIYLSTNDLSYWNSGHSTRNIGSDGYVSKKTESGSSGLSRVVPYTAQNNNAGIETRPGNRTVREWERIA